MSVPHPAYHHGREAVIARIDQVRHVVAAIISNPALITGEALGDTVDRLSRELEVESVSARSAIMSLVGTDILTLGAELRVTATAQ